MPARVLFAAALVLTALTATEARPAPASPCDSPSRHPDSSPCADARIAAEAEEIARLLRAAEERLSEAGRRLLAEDQRGWAAFVRAACRVEPEGEPDGRSPAIEDCFRLLHRERVEHAADIVRAVGPFTVLRLTFRAARPVPGAVEDAYENGMRKGVLKAEVQHDWIDPPADPSAGRRAARWNDHALALVLEIVGDRTAAADADDFGDDPEDAGGRIEILHATPDLIGYDHERWWYNHGAPRSLAGSAPATFDLDAARDVKPADLFDQTPAWSELVLRPGLIASSDDPDRDDGECESYRAGLERPAEYLDAMPWRIAEAGVVMEHSGDMLGYHCVYLLAWDEMRPFLTERGRRWAEVP